MVTFHLSLGLEDVGPDLLQWMGEVFSLLYHWLKITAEVDAELAADHAKRVAARRDERQLITVAARQRERPVWDEPPRERLSRGGSWPL